MPRVHANPDGESALFHRQNGGTLERIPSDTEHLTRDSSLARSASTLFTMDADDRFSWKNGALSPVSLDIVTINIGGFVYQTRASTLARVPTSLLADPSRRQHFYDPATGAYFFDRNRLAFDSILEFYRTGKLVKPTAIPVYVFVREMLFFDLGDEMIDNFLRKEELLDEPPILPTNRIQRAIYELFNCPESSLPAKILACFDIAVVMTAILSLCALSMPHFQDVVATGGQDEDGVNFTMQHRKMEYRENKFTNPFFVVDVICNTWFMFDVVVRFVVCPDKRHFFSSFMTFVDCISIVPFLVDVIATAATHNVYSGPSLQFLLAFRILRLFRMFKVFKMDDYSDGLKVLTQTISTANKELGIGALFLFVGAVFFATTMYYAERETTNTDYTSIPASLWWAVITWTTIGYGDIFPKTVSGKIVGCICAITGVLALGMLVPPVVRRFEHYFYRAENMQELEAVFNEYWADKEKRKTARSQIAQSAGKDHSKDFFHIA